MNTCASSWPISEQTAAVESARLTATELTHEVRDRIEDAEPRLRAWVTLASDVSEQARRVDAAAASALPLRGVSIGVKDLIDVAGLPTRAGSSITSPEAATTDAACVARFKELGAIIQGKTVTTEFGYFAPGPTRNPHAPDHTPGGSSSGSAAAVGAGTIALALGTQTAGSLTRPASFCGAAGMVLAQGAASLVGVTGLSESLDSLGMLTRTVEDLRFVYRAYVGDQGARNIDVHRVLLWEGSGLDDVSPPMRRLLQQTPLLINNLGIECQPLDWDDHVHSLAADHAVVMAYEAAHMRATELARHGETMSTPLRDLLESGSRVDLEDHQAALSRRDRSRRLLHDLLGDGTLIVGPAALGPAPAGLAATGSPILSRAWQLLGLPVVVVPGATSSGLPMGLQIIGFPGREYDMLDLGVELEGLLHGVRPVGEGFPA